MVNSMIPFRPKRMDRGDWGLPGLEGAVYSTSCKQLPERRPEQFQSSLVCLHPQLLLFAFFLGSGFHLDLHVFFFVNDVDLDVAAMIVLLLLSLHQIEQLALQLDLLLAKAHTLVTYFSVRQYQIFQH